MRPILKFLSSDRHIRRVRQKEAADTSFLIEVINSPEFESAIFQTSKSGVDIRITPKQKNRLSRLSPHCIADCSSCHSRRKSIEMKLSVNQRERFHGEYAGMAAVLDKKSREPNLLLDSRRYQDVPWFGSGEAEET